MLPHDRSSATAARNIPAATVHAAGLDVPVGISPEGVTVGDRVLPWEALLALPRCYAVISDGWLDRSYPTEQLAVDRVCDLRNTGAAAFVIRVPYGVTI